LSDVPAAVGLNRPPHCICGSPTPDTDCLAAQNESALMFTGEGRLRGSTRRLTAVLIARYVIGQETSPERLVPAAWRRFRPFTGP